MRDKLKPVIDKHKQAIGELGKEMTAEVETHPLGKVSPMKHPSHHSGDRHDRTRLTRPCCRRLAASVHAADYPERPIEFVVPSSRRRRHRRDDAHLRRRRAASTCRSRSS